MVKNKEIKWFKLAKILAGDSVKIIVGSWVGGDHTLTPCVVTVEPNSKATYTEW